MVSRPEPPYSPQDEVDESRFHSYYLGHLCSICLAIMIPSLSPVDSQSLVKIAPVRASLCAAQGHPGRHGGRASTQAGASLESEGRGGRGVRNSSC